MADQRGLIELEHDVPLPRSVKYPWGAMQIGDSFFVAEPPKGIRSMIYAASKRYGVRYVSRTVDGGLRVWRAA